MMSRDLFFVDLPKDRRLVPDRPISPTKDTNHVTSRANDNSVPGRTQTTTFASSDAAEVARRQLVADFRRAGFDAVKAVITHLGLSNRKAPQPTQSYLLSLPS